MSDKKLRRAIRAQGSLNTESWRHPFPSFHSLIRSIMHQQVSGKAAESILKKFKSLYAGSFPTPTALLNTPIAALRSAGLSGQKAAYVQDLALKFSNGTIKPRRFPKMSNSEIIEHLVRVKGIGVWTAHMFLLFTLKRPDILPTLDLGIRKGFQVVYALKKLPDHEQMEKIARPWRAHASLVSLYLWRVADSAKKK